MYVFIHIHSCVNSFSCLFLSFFLLSFAPRRVPPAPRLDANCAGQGCFWRSVVVGDAGWRTRSCLAEPKADWVKLGRPWPLVGPNTSRLGPNLGLTCAATSLRSNIAQLGCRYAKCGNYHRSAVNPQWEPSFWWWVDPKRSCFGTFGASGFIHSPI